MITAVGEQIEYDSITGYLINNHWVCMDNDGYPYPLKNSEVRITAILIDGVWYDVIYTCIYQDYL